MEVRGANRFVRFLRVANLGLILALVVILGAVELFTAVAGSPNAFWLSVVESVR
jgi:hypothetical protein